MDYQAALVGFAAVVTAVGTIIIGVKNGNNVKAKDQLEARSVLELAQEKRDLAVEEATKARIEALALDASAARKRARELEDEFYERADNLRQDVEDIRKEKEDVRRWGQKGWDLAAHHFGLVVSLDHLLGNIFQVHEFNPEATPSPLYEIISGARQRKKAFTIPITLESPLEESDTKAK